MLVAVFAPRWFEWHATFQTVGFFIALGSGLLIIVHLSWNKFPGTPNTTKPPHSGHSPD